MILILTLFAFVLSLFASWAINEDDIYGQIRAGTEILKTHSVQSIDTWTSTMSGKSIVNYQWLSDVLFKGIYSLGGNAALVWARILCTFALLSFVTAIYYRRSISLKGASRWTIGLSVITLSFLVLNYRLQIRPEIFTLIGFTWILFQAQKTIDKTTVLSMVIAVWVSTQFHAGTAIYCVFIALYFLIFKSTLTMKEKAIFSLGICISYFLTPEHFNIVPMLLLHFSYDNSVIGNIEWMPIGSFLLSIPELKIPILTWVLVIVVGVLFLLGRPSKKIIPELVVLALFSWMAFTRIRMIPFAFLFLVAVFPFELVRLKKAWQHVGLVGVVVVMFFFQVTIKPPFKFVADRQLFSMDLVDFIGRRHLEQNVFNGFAAGSYMLMQLPTYKVFIDPRDTLFNELKPHLLMSMRDPVTLHRLFDKFNVKTALFPVIPEQFRERFFPHNEWARVLTDGKNDLYVKRIPEHELVIKQFGT